MNFQTYSSYAALLNRFALLLFAITPVTYGTPWLAILVSITMLLSFTISFVIAYRIYRRDKAAGLRCVAGQPRDRYYDVMISITGLLIYSLTGLVGMILIWAVLLIASFLEIRNNRKKGIY